MPLPKQLIDTAGIARLEEARIAAAYRDLADDWRPLAGGVMARTAPGSWLNATVGAGLAGPASDDDAAAIVEFYSSKGIEPRVELCSLADPSLTRALERAGFVLRAFDNVLYRQIGAGDAFAPPLPTPDGLEIETVDPTNAAAVREYVIAAVSGFLPAGATIPDVNIESAERAVRHPRSVSFVARLPREAGQQVVAAGAIEAAGELAVLYGLSVAPSFRRRGIQQAMLAHRLHAAAQRGARHATIGSHPGAHTERNVRRMGFELAYTKASVVKPGPGLVAAGGD